MSFPGSVISLTNPSGTSLLSGPPDHGLLHGSVNTEIIAIENFLGTNGASSVFGGFNFGDKAAKRNFDTLGSPTINTPQINGGTANNITLGTADSINSTFSGGTLNSTIKNNGTIAGGVYGTALHMGGTLANGLIGSTTVLQPLTSAFFYQGSSTLTSGSPVPFLTNQLDTLSEYNGTYFIPKQGGIYLFFTGLYTSGNAGDFNIEIAYNGTVQALTRGNPNGYGIPVSWLGTVSTAGSVNVVTGGTGAIGTSSYFFGKRVF